MRQRHRIAIPAAGAVAALLLSAAGGPAQPAPAGDESPGPPVCFEAPGAPVEAPFVLEGDQPVVEVMVEGQGPFRFILDTGASGEGQVSDELADSLGLSTVGEIQVGDPSGQNTETRSLVEVGRLELAGLVARRVPMSRAAQLFPLDGVDGILGFPLFHDLLLTLDYPGRKVRMEAGELPPPDGREILANVSEHGIVTVEMEVAGRQVPFDVDSGSPGWMLVPADVARELPLEGEPVVVGTARTSLNTFDIKRAALAGEARLGEHRYASPSIEFAEIFPRGNVGGEFLAPYVVTFDGRNARVRFLRSDDGPLRRPGRYRVGVMLAPGEDGLRVDGTIPGGPADRAGLRAGDLVTAVNGRPVAALAPGDMRKIFGGPDEIELTVERDGAERTVRVRPEPSG